MEINERKEGGILVMGVQGRLDHDAAEAFKAASLARIAAGERRILVDFGGTTFLASMGIRALIIPSQEIAQHGGKMAITGLSNELQKLFTTAGLHQLFTVYSTLDEALASDSWPASA